MNLSGERYLSAVFGTDCPCKREGKGCPWYTMVAEPPYYICVHTGKPAYVPGSGGEAGDVQIFGLMAD